MTASGSKAMRAERASMSAGQASHQKGFALLLAVLAIGLVGATLIVLQTGSSRLAFGSDNAYLQASQRDLVASGLAWARANAAAAGSAASAPAGLSTASAATSLDVERLGIPRAVLRVSLDPQSSHVLIATECQRGSMHLRHESRLQLR